MLRDKKGRFVKGHTILEGWRDKMRTRKGKPAWSKGLTKETDDRLKRMGRLNRQYQLRRAKNGSHVGFKKGFDINRIDTQFKEGYDVRRGKPFTSKNGGKYILNTGRTRFKKGGISEDLRKKALKSIIKKPNKKEEIIIKLIKENNLPFNYVGYGQILIGGFNPDFLSNNPKHIIELNGDYWHNLPDIKDKDRRKLETYSKYGYKTLVIWEHELRDTNQVLNKIKEFIK